MAQREREMRTRPILQALFPRCTAMDRRLLEVSISPHSSQLEIEGNTERSPKYFSGGFMLYSSLILVPQNV